MENKMITKENKNKQHKETKIKCEICGKYLNYVTGLHLKTHCITFDEYKEQFPNALSVSEDYRKKLSKSNSGKNNSMYGKEAWSKGKTKETDVRLEKSGNKISKTRKEFFQTEEGQEWLDNNYRGENHPLYGKEPWIEGLTKETNEAVKKLGEKVSKTKSEFFTTEEGQRWLDENNRGENHPMYGKGYLISGEKNGMYGDKASNWKGGISFEPYCEKFNGDFKERVRDFFGRCCYVCGKNEIDNGEKLSVHHVNYDKMVCCNDVKPLFVPLCRSCHAKTYHNREYWEEFFTVSLEYLTNGDCFIPKEQENMSVKTKEIGGEKI